MTSLVSIVQLYKQLADLKEKRANLHVKLIDTNRLVKRGEAVPESAIQVKKEMADMTSKIRSLEHDLSILTLTLIQTASIEETPYGRTIKYDKQETE
jgi:hypothetical protein